MKELERHEYRVSPGLIHPFLHSLEQERHLNRKTRVIGRKARKYATALKGQEMLEAAKRLRIREPVEEVM